MKVRQDGHRLLYNNLTEMRTYIKLVTLFKVCVHASNFHADKSSSGISNTVYLFLLWIVILWRVSKFC